MVRFKKLPNGEDLITLIDDPAPEPQPTETVPQIYISANRIKGLLLMAGSGLLYCTAMALAKFMSDITPGEIGFVQAVITLLITIPMLFFHDISIVNFSHKRYVILRAIFGSMGYIITIWCVQHMRFGDSIVLVYMSPMFAGFFAKIVLGETFGVVNLAGSFACVIGALLVTQPGIVFGEDDNVTPIGILGTCMALVAATLIGVSYVAVRIAAHANPLIMIFYFNILTLPISMIYQLTVINKFHIPSCYHDRGLLTITGILIFFSQNMLHNGLAIEASAPASLMRNLDIVIGYIYQVLVFKETMDVLSLLGAIMILLSTSIIFIHKLLKDQQRKGDEIEVSEAEPSQSPPVINGALSITTSH